MKKSKLSHKMQLFIADMNIDDRQDTIERIDELIAKGIKETMQHEETLREIRALCWEFTDFDDEVEDEC